MEPPLEGGTKVYIKGPGHMTKMAAKPIYEYGKKKTLKIFYSKTGSFMILKFGMQRQGLKFYKICINCDPGLNLTYFTARSNSET